MHMLTYVYNCKTDRYKNTVFNLELSRHLPELTTIRCTLALAKGHSIHTACTECMQILPTLLPSMKVWIRAN